MSKNYRKRSKKLKTFQKIENFKTTIVISLKFEKQLQETTENIKKQLEMQNY